MTFADLALMLRDAVRDRSYTTKTELGPAVEAFLGYFRTERGRTEETIRSFEYTLARLALFYADQPLSAFEPPAGTRMLRDFLRHFYADVAGNTWNTKVATLKALFRWAIEEDRLVADPAAKLRYRQVGDTERKAHAPERLVRLTTAQPERRDRVAIQLMARLALRRNELRQVQFKHLDTRTGELTVFGKGQTILRVAVFDDLLEQWLRHALERQANADEFLLYPQKIGKVGRYPNDRLGVIWEDRLSPLSLSGIDKWWRRCLQHAAMSQFPMHELRHSAGTNFYRETRDLKLTQLLMRHQKSATTADTYLHLDQADLAAAMRELPPWAIEEG